VQPEAEADLDLDLYGSDEEDGTEDDDDGGEYGYNLPAPPLPDGYDEAADLNDPNLIALPDAPMIGGRGSANILGQDVPTTGAPSSPKLWASSARQPDAQKLYVYKVDPNSGAPISIGSIQSDASEDAFLRHFFLSMPKPGEGVATFQLRPANAFGKEVGSMGLRHVSAAHTTLAQLREEEKAMSATGLPNFMMGGGDGSAGVVAAELSTQIGAMQESFLSHHQLQLEEMREERDREREVARDAIMRTSDERIAQQQSLASTQQAMFDKMLATEKARAGETVQSQKESSQFMLQLLTGMSTQTRESMMADAERRAREEDVRAQREREYFAQVHREDQARRDRERADLEARWQREREAAKEDQLRRAAETQAALETAKLELQAREKAMKEETERRMQEFKAQMEALAVEREARDRRDREERESRERREKDERDEKARREKEERDSRERAERERFDREKSEERERREREREREERREKAEREEREARERREKEDRDAKERREREEREAREKRESEDKARVESERRMAHDLAIKRMEEERLALQSRQDREASIAREHAERLAGIAAADRAAAMTADERRLASERADAEMRERDRERAHKAEMERLERQHQQAQAHETRMFELQKMQAGGSDRLGDLTKMLGVDPAEALRKLFVPEEGMTDQVMKGVGALAEAWFRAQSQGRPAAQPQPSARQVVTIQTPEGPKQITAEAFRNLQAQARQIPGPQQPPVPPGFASAVVPPPPLPPASADDGEPVVSVGVRTSEPAPESTPEPEETALPPEYVAAKEVNVLSRSREAKISTPSARAMRKLAKDMVQKMEKSDPSEWEGLLTATLATRLDFLDYLRAVTVWAAVVDTQAPPEVCVRIVAFVREAERGIREGLGSAAPLLPFTEEDLVAFRAAAASEAQA
jgi:hypothetical protein